MSRKLIAVLLLVAAAAVAVGADRVLPPAGQDVIPGVDTFKYDDGSRYRKVGYGSGGIGKGWGVKFNMQCYGCMWLNELHVNLCPPPLEDGPYKAEFVVYPIDPTTGLPDVNNIILRDTFDVRVGCWWHYQDVSWMKKKVWYPGFYVFVYPVTYPQVMFQWFDQYDNAPLGTQWYHDGTNFIPYTSVGFGDIGIRAVVEAHDVSPTAIIEPLGTLLPGQWIHPRAWFQNHTDMWAEDSVPVKFWIEPFPRGSGPPVYVDIDTFDFPASTTPFVHEFDSVQVTWPAGNYVVGVATMAYCDYNRANDTVFCNITVLRRDVGCIGVCEPRGWVAPGYRDLKCMVQNFGNWTETFPVSYTIWDSLGQNRHTVTQWVYNLAPNEKRQVNFGQWYVPPCSVTLFTPEVITMLPEDVYRANDTCQGVFRVTCILRDGGVTTIVSPTGTIQNNTRYRLKATAMNFGTQLDSFAVRCSLIRPNGTFVNYTRKVTLGGGAWADVQFANRRYVALGTWKVVSWTQLLAPGGTPVPDQNAWNDTAIGTFVSVAPQPGWDIVEEMPTGEYVNAGASITTGEGDFFLLKGKRSPEVYRVGEEVDANVIASVPEEGRKVGHGTQMVYLDGKLYLLKANKSFEFFSLDPATGEWTRLADVPAGASERAPKKGASMTVVDGKVYLLKGNKTREFFVYDPATDAWTELAGMPAGDKLKPVKGGGALTSLNGRIFAFKGNKTTEYYTYDITTNVWQQLADVPVRRLKDGACLASVDGTIYASIGGSKMSFWSYDVFTNAWTEQDEVPLDPDRRKVKYGASMAALDGYLLFVKGRKTEYVLAYVPETGSDGAGVQPEKENVMGSPTDVRPSMVMAPNPASGRVRVSYSAGNSSAASGRLYSSTGQLVSEFAIARGSADLNVSELANGVYLVRVSDGAHSLTQRLVIQH